VLRDLLGVRIQIMRGQEEAAEALANTIARRHALSAADWDALAPFVR